MAENQPSCLHNVMIRQEKAKKWGKNMGEEEEDNVGVGRLNFFFRFIELRR